MAIQPVELDEQLEIASGRRAPYTQLGDWVALSGISTPAKALYWHLAMHVNQQRGDFEVWPTRYVLAEWCGFNKAESVDRYLDELVAIDAIEVYQRRYGTGMRRRNVYVINQEPPEDWTGPRSLKEFYAARACRTRSSTRTSSVNPQVTPENEHTKSGRSTQENGESSGASSAEFGNEFSQSPGHTVVRWSGSREVRSSASREVRSSGPEQEEEKPDEGKPPSSYSSHESAAPSAGQSDDGKEGGRKGTSQGQPDSEVVQMLQEIPTPAHKRKPGPRSAKLGEVAARCSQILADPQSYGLTLADLRRHLAVDLETVQYSITAVWLARLADDELPAPRQTRTQPTPSEEQPPAPPATDLTAEDLLARGLDPRLLPKRLRQDDDT